MISPLNLLSWNVKGLNHPIKEERFLHKLSKKMPPLSFYKKPISEVWITHGLCLSGRGSSSFPVLRPRPEEYPFSSALRVHFEHLNVISDRHGRFVIVSGRLYNTQVVLVNAYAPNTDDPKFFGHLFSNLPDLGSYSLILGGDLNCWLDPVLDRSSLKPACLSKSFPFFYIWG